MYPRTKAGAEKYRKKKRVIEIGLIIRHIEQFIHRNLRPEMYDLQILEFGSGSGFQAPYLQKLGYVAASDIHVSDGMRKILSEVNFLQCSITDAPFKDGHFDLIFSNHAIEHIEDLDSAFREMKRIGKPSCIYAFSIPTNIWLLLSLPAQYYLKVQKFLKLIFKIGKEDKEAERLHKPDRSDEPVIIRGFRPRGHGVIYSYLACYRAFRIDTWRGLFERNGLVIKEVHPLLLYAASEWPIIPLTAAFNRFNICSSVLLLMQKG